MRSSLLVGLLLAGAQMTGCASNDGSPAPAEAEVHYTVDCRCGSPETDITGCTATCCKEVKEGEECCVNAQCICSPLCATAEKEGRLP